jgi:hypothetical protein
MVIPLLSPVVLVFFCVSGSGFVYISKHGMEQIVTTTQKAWASLYSLVPWMGRKLVQSQHVLPALFSAKWISNLNPKSNVDKITTPQLRKLRK